MKLIQTFAAAAVLVSAPAFTQDADTQEVENYVLTEAGLAKYTQAFTKLAELEKDTPANCDEESGDTSLNAMTAKLNAVPGAKAAIQAAGMTTREYVVFSWAVMHNGLAAWALSQPGGKLSPGATKANVAFYREHEAELNQLGALTKGDACDEESEE